jgi:hypothetical protein
MRIIDAGSPSPPPRTRCAALSIAFAASLWFSCGSVPQAHAQSPRYAFAVIAGTMQSAADEAPTQRLLEAIGRERDLSFIVYDGNLKGAKEACRDALYERREAVLETARPALFFIPGQHDWTDCGTVASGGFDPVERLDQLRQTLFADSTSMGQNPIALTRESEVSRFRPYRENVRWLVGDTVFVGMNAPGPNNHYLTAGGRNGEFEDRVIANAFWLEHAAEFAKRREARAIVIFIQGDPDPERYERPDRFAWLRFARNTRRDGFLEFKRSLVKLAQIYRGPVLVIHCDDERAPSGFVIDQPLRNDKGLRVTNLTRVALAPHDRLNQWIRIEVDLAKKPPFRVSVRDVPKQMPMPAVQPMQPYDESAPPMPAVSAPGSAPELPPLLPAPPSIPAQQQLDLQQQQLMPGGQNGSAPGSTGLPQAPGAPYSVSMPGMPAGSAGSAASSTSTPGLLAPSVPASSVQRGP